MLDYVQNEPYGIDDLIFFDQLCKLDEYYPFSPQTNAIIDEKVVSGMLRLGYIYDYTTSEWYARNFNGLYDFVSEDIVKRDIQNFLSMRAPSGVNIPVKNVQSILERLRACSFMHSCSQKYEDFLLNHEQYEIPYFYDHAELMGRELIPVKNGLINPATMELLPHCAYLLHHTIYNFGYTKLTEDEIFSHPAYDTYAGIIPDKDTLHLFLWWVGMVLFSPELPRVLMVLYGNAGTGKTTLSLGLSRILTPSRSLQLNLNAFKNSRFIASSFADKQLIVIDEMSNSAGLLDDALFKQLTGGTSNFTIEEKYKNPRNVELRSKFLLIGNSYPAFIQDGAIYDRLFLIPCENKQDKSIRDLVVSNDHLNWLFNAAYYFYVVKQPQKDIKSVSELKTPLMLRELERYRDTDAFITWIKDYLDTDGLTVEVVQRGLDHQPTKNVYDHYKTYVLDIGGKPISMMKFNSKLRQDYGLSNVSIRDKDCVYKGYRVAGDE